MLEYFMPKFIPIFIFPVLLLLSLHAKEPMMAILQNVISNEMQKFTFGNYSFVCEAYGVVSLEKLYENSQNNSTCQESIKSFYKKNPYLQYYIESILKSQAMYHVELKEKGCVIYVQGKKTLSEVLLEEGLAVNQPSFEDEEYNYSFLKLQQRAKNNKKGVWSEDILRSCVDSLYKDEK